MPSLGLGEILIILVIALVVFGPKRLPEMGRSIGKGLREFRRATSDLRSEIEDDMDLEDEPPPRTSRPASPRTPSPSSGERQPDESPGAPASD
jgi:sec-independent protein translocase protein TatA